MAEQILIELVADASKIEPAVVILQKLGKLSDDELAEIKKLTDAAAKGFDGMNKSAQATIPSIGKIQQATEQLSQTVVETVQNGIVDAFVEAGGSAQDFGKKARQAGDTATKSFSDLEKKMIAGTYKKTVDDIAKSLGMTTEKAKAFVQQMAKNGQLKINGEVTEDLRLLQQAIIESGDEFENFVQQIDEFNDSTDGAEKKSQSFKARLRELKNELQQLEDQGKENTAEFQALAIEAARLEDQIGDTQQRIRTMASDTFGFDAVISGISGVTAGFSVAQGAAALFGQGEEDVQKALLKVNAAMAILQGLQQIQQTLQRQSAISIAVENAQRKIGVLQTELQAGAESKNIIVKYASIVAQKALNAVMAASPAGLLLIAIGAIAGALLIFSSNSETAAQKQDKLNKKLLEELNYLEEIDKKFRQPFDDNIKGLERELNLLKSKGASQKDILKKEQELAQAQAQRASNSKGFYAQEASNLEANKQALIEQQKKLRDLKDEAESTRRQGGFFQGLFTTDRKKSDIEDDIKAVESGIEVLQKKVELGTQANNEYFDAVAAAAAKAAEIAKKNYDDDLKSFAAFADAKVLKARQGSIAELEAQKEAIQARLKLEQNDPNLTAGERARNEAQAARDVLDINNKIKINVLEDHASLISAKLAKTKEGTIEELELQKKLAAKTFEIQLANLENSDAKNGELRAQMAKEQEDFDRQIAQKKIEIELNGIRARLAAAKEGSAEEFKLRLQEAQKQRDSDLKQKGLTDDKRLLIEAEYLKKVRDMTKQHNFEVAQDALNTKLSETNSKLAELQIAGVSETNTELLQLKKDAIDEQAALDELSAREQIKNEEQLQKRLIEIRTKATADKVTLERQAQQSIIDTGLQYATTWADNEMKRQQLVINGAGLDFKTRKAALDKIKNLEQAKLDAEEAALKESLAKKTISQEQYNQKILELEGKRLDKELQMQQEKEQRKKEIMEAGFGILQQISDGLFQQAAQDRQATLDAELKRLEDTKARELDNKNLTEQQKADIETKYKRKEAQEKLKAWKADQDAAAKQALINGALGFAKALPNFVLAGAALASALLQVAFIRGQRPPQFAKGTRNAPRGYAWVGEEGPELVQLSGGEKIWAYAQSNKVAAAWDKGVMQTPDEILAGNLPSHVDAEMISNTYVNAGGNLMIDYERLGKSISKHIPPPVQNQINLDENGFSKHIYNEGNKTTIRNQRYKMN